MPAVLGPVAVDVTPTATRARIRRTAAAARVLPEHVECGQPVLETSLGHITQPRHELVRITMADDALHVNDHIPHVLTAIDHVAHVALAEQNLGRTGRVRRIVLGVELPPPVVTDFAFRGERSELLLERGHAIDGDLGAVADGR